MPSANPTSFSVLSLVVLSALSSCTRASRQPPDPQAELISMTIYLAGRETLTESVLSRYFIVESPSMRGPAPSARREVQPRTDGLVGNARYVPRPHITRLLVSLGSDPTGKCANLADVSKGLGLSPLAPDAYHVGEGVPVTYQWGGIIGEHRVTVVSREPPAPGCATGLIIAKDTATSR